MRCFDMPEPVSIILFTETGPVTTSEPMTVEEIAKFIDRAFKETTASEAMVVRHGVEVRTIKKKP